VGFLGVRRSAIIALRMTRAPINLALDPQMTAYFPVLGCQTGAALVSIPTLESCQNPEIWKVYEFKTRGWKTYGPAISGISDLVESLKVQRAHPRERFDRFRWLACNS
jgi:hypothetical protein